MENVGGASLLRRALAAVFLRRIERYVFVLALATSRFFLEWYFLTGVFSWSLLFSLDWRFNPSHASTFFSWRAFFVIGSAAFINVAVVFATFYLTPLSFCF